MKSKKINKQNGFTIIETMIAVALFLVIVMAGMGALLNANLLHQKSQDMRSIMDSLNFIMEDISRNLRTGYDYRCITAASDFDLSVIGQTKSGENCWGIAFESSSTTVNVSNPNNQWAYYIDTAGRIFRATHDPYTDPLIDPSSEFVQLSPSEVVLTGNVAGVQISGFSVLGAESPSSPSPNSLQPFVTIRLVGKIFYKNVDTPFSLQTSVSQRAIDI